MSRVGSSGMLFDNMVEDIGDRMRSTSKKDKEDFDEEVAEIIEDAGDAETLRSRLTNATMFRALGIPPGYKGQPPEWADRKWNTDFTESFNKEQLAQLLWYVERHAALIKELKKQNRRATNKYEVKDKSIVEEILDTQGRI